MLRYRKVFFTIDCPDGVLELQPPCGGLRGDTLMVFMWLSAFAPLIAKWQTSQCSFDCFSRFSICSSLAGNATDGSLTVYADDVAKYFHWQDAGRYRSATASTAITYLTASEKSLQDCLEPAGIAPNNDKTEAIPTFFGEGSFHARRVFRVLARPRQVDDIWVVCIRIVIPMLLRSQPESIQCGVLLDIWVSSGKHSETRRWQRRLSIQTSLAVPSVVLKCCVSVKQIVQELIGQP